MRGGAAHDGSVNDELNANSRKKPNLFAIYSYLQWLMKPVHVRDKRSYRTRISYNFFRQGNFFSRSLEFRFALSHISEYILLSYTGTIVGITYGTVFVIL